MTLFKTFSKCSTRGVRDVVASANISHEQTQSNRVSAVFKRWMLHFQRISFQIISQQLSLCRVEALKSIPVHLYSAVVSIFSRVQYFYLGAELQGGTSVVVPYCYLFVLSVFILCFTYYMGDIF